MGLGSILNLERIDDPKNPCRSPLVVAERVVQSISPVLTDWSVQETESAGRRDGPWPSWTERPHDAYTTLCRLTFGGYSGQYWWVRVSVTPVGHRPTDLIRRDGIRVRHVDAAHFDQVKDAVAGTRPPVTWLSVSRAEKARLGAKDVWMHATGEIILDPRRMPQRIDLAIRLSADPCLVESVFHDRLDVVSMALRRLGRPPLENTDETGT